MRLSSSGSIIAYALVLPFIAMLGACGLFLWVNASTPSVSKLNVAYLSGDANLRTCPSAKCPSSAVYSEGQQVVVIRTVKGQNVAGTNKWVAVRFGNSERYINSYFVNTKSVESQNTFWLIVSATAAILVVLFMVGVNSNKLKELFTSRGDKLDILLLGFVLATGIVMVGVAYLYSSFGQQSSPVFLSATFDGLGAGLIGAAITFGLFQSLLSRRIVDAQKHDQKLNDLGNQIEALARQMVTIDDKLSSKIGSPTSRGGRQAQQLNTSEHNVTSSKIIGLLERVRLWRGNSSGFDK